MAGVLFACVALPGVAQTAGQVASPGAASPQQQHMMPRPTNLQVLPKDIAPADLIKTMHGYTAALGVHCSFCHEVDETTHHANFASDSKPEKAIARTMIAMTEEINSKYLSQVNDPDATPAIKTVTCGTCHRGNSMPVPFVPPPEGQHPPMGAMPMPKK
jgi:mono/diheme cytochrome c family protein